MIEVRICGIPAQAEITHYEPGHPGKLSGHPDTWYPPEGDKLEYKLYDRKGYRAEWLERKIRGTEEEKNLISFLLEIVR